MLNQEQHPKGAAFLYVYRKKTGNARKDSHDHR